MGEHTLEYHLREVKGDRRRFENAFQAVSRMIQAGGFEKINALGRTVYNFKAFRQGKKHIIGMYDELERLVSYIKDGAQKGSPVETAFVLIGEPGNGKTFLVDYMCSAYRRFTLQPGNERYTFKFKNLGKLGTWETIEIKDPKTGEIIKDPETGEVKTTEVFVPSYGPKIRRVESQTYEDPMILAMNLFGDREDNIKFLREQGFTDEQIETFFRHYRPLGACTDYILNQIKEHIGGEDLEKLRKFIEVVRVRISPNSGALTGQYSAKDKITSSAIDLCGDQDLMRKLNITDTDNPYMYDLREGALARVAGGGIHFADELFRNKPDLINIYLRVIQNREIELKGHKWPMDTLILATSNNDKFNSFREEKEQAPIIDRCDICFMSHNTNYKLQRALTLYALGDPKTTFAAKKMHEDPNLNYALSVAMVLTRLPETEKLTLIETMKLASGDVAGEKSIETLAEVIDDLSHDIDITKHFGQKGLSHRKVGETLRRLLSKPETNEGECMYAGDVFDAVKKVVLYDISDKNDRAKYLRAIEVGKGLYREQVMKGIFNAYMDDPKALEEQVLNYVNMIVAMEAKDLGSDKKWTYKDPQTGEANQIKVDRRFINSVEERLGMKTEDEKNAFRTTIIKIYGQKLTQDPNYNFMDNNDLVKAVTEVRIMSDVGSAASLVGALANRQDKKNARVYNSIIRTMTEKLRYCRTCAQKTIEYFCTHEDES